MFSQDDMAIEVMVQETEETSAPAQICQRTEELEVTQTTGKICVFFILRRVFIVGT